MTGGRVASVASSVATPPTVTAREATAGSATGFPILDKHTKPLVGSDTAKAVRYVEPFALKIRALCGYQFLFVLLPLI